MESQMDTKTPIKALLSGIWHNQHNSEMHLEVDESGKIVGCFTNGIKTGSERCESFALTGFAKEDIFVFCVDFSKYGCMTTWIGQIIDPERKEFRAMWQMIGDAHGNEALDWRSIWIGQDEFTAGPRKSELSQSRTPASHPMYNSII